MKFVLCIYTIQHLLHFYNTISDRIFPAIRAHRRKLNVQHSSIRFNSIFSISFFLSLFPAFETVRCLNMCDGFFDWFMIDNSRICLMFLFFLYPNLLDWQQQRQWAIYAFTKTGNNKTTAIKLCVLCLGSPVISNEWYAVKRQRIMATIPSYFLSSISFAVSLACVKDSIQRLSSI